MSILSITFHTVESQLQNWEQYLENELITLVENFIDVENYILSEVNTEMLTEGKNTNLLLIFESDEKRQEFTETELYNLSEIIARKFGDNVMLFKTKLNEKKSRFYIIWIFFNFILNWFIVYLIEFLKYTRKEA